MEQMSLDIESTGKPSLAQPLVSVIMPVRNEAVFIEQSLGAVLSQDYPRDRLEILISDGMSTDETRALIKACSQKHPDIRLVVLENRGQIVSTGFNAALAQARGEVIIRVDGHTLIEPDYVRQCMAALSRSGADNVGGPMKARSDNPFGRAVALATSSPFGVGGARFHYSDREEWVDTVYLGAWPRRTFERVGTFDEEMVRNQDDEFNYRLASLGGKILLTPQIKSHYYNRPTMASLWRQYFEYGYWKVRVMQKHLTQMRPRHFAPALFISILLATLLISVAFSWALYLALALATTYLFAVVTASILSVRRGRFESLSLLPIAFGILHFAYGSGFLIGLVRFWNRWRGRSGRMSSPVSHPGCHQ